jgi:hypothetical protein
METGNYLTSTRYRTLFLISLLPIVVIIFLAGSTATKDQYEEKVIGIPEEKDIPLENKSAYSECLARGKSILRPDSNEYIKILCGLRHGKKEIVKINSGKVFVLEFISYLPIALSLFVAMNVLFLASVLHIRCESLGWKRVSLIFAAIGPLICIILAFNRFWRLSHSNEFFQFIATLISSYFIALLLLHVGRKVFLWVKEGYQTQPTESVVVPELRPEAEKPYIQQAAAQKTEAIKAVSSNKLVREKSMAPEKEEKKKRFYLGYGRRIFSTGLFVLIISIPIAFSYLHNSGYSPGTMIALIAIPIVYLLSQRLINIGHDRKTVILLAVPVVNMLLLIYCLSVPEGFADTREIDKTGKIIGLISGVIIFTLLIFLFLSR